MSEIRFFVQGKSQPAGSKKAFGLKLPNGHVRTSVVDANDKAKPWKELVALTAQQHCPESLLTGPIELKLVFHVTRPPGHFGTGRNAGIVKARAPERPTVRPDVLKLARGVEDALTKVIWKDDAQIVDEHLHKVFSEKSGVEIVIREL
jgi:Holliday junction resolvase RusA-like endonuclease